MLVDSGGFRWLNETWLKVDRGVKFYNNAAIPPDSASWSAGWSSLPLGLLAVVAYAIAFRREAAGHVSRRTAGAAAPRPKAPLSPGSRSRIRSHHWG